MCNVAKCWKQSDGDVGVMWVWQQDAPRRFGDRMLHDWQGRLYHVAFTLLWCAYATVHRQTGQHESKAVWLALNCMQRRRYVMRALCLAQGV